MLLITVLLSLAYGLLMIWYAVWWQRIDKRPPFPDPPNLPHRVSVIVPVRNEGQNITACLTALVKQNYPLHLTEIIVVDDASEDDSAERVLHFAQHYTQVHLLPLPPMLNSKAHKKRALEAGIARASGEIIVCTDADCTMGPKWLSHLVSPFDHSAIQFVAAPVVYHFHPTLLSIFQGLDFMTLQGITGASVLSGLHDMCNGANLAYRKDAFNAVNGFAGIDDLPTGDDMLLMHKITKRYQQRAIWLKHSAAIVTTEPPNTWGAFLNQRVRWASKATYFEDKKIIAVLGGVYLLNCWCLVLTFYGFWNLLAFSWLTGLLAFKTTIELFFLWPVAKFFDRTKYLMLFPLLQPIHVAYTIIAGWLGQFGSYEWKGRRISKQ